MTRHHLLVKMVPTSGAHHRWKFYQISAYHRIDRHYHHKIHQIHNKHHKVNKYTLPYISLQIRVITLLKCISGGYDNSYVSHFYSSKNKAFGMNASPESAMSPSISSVATSASEVSTPIRLLLHFTLIFIKSELFMGDFHVFHCWNWCIYEILNVHRYPMEYQ